MELLFATGSAINVYPIKMTRLVTETRLQYPVQAMFVVPKRSFKKAHDRNLLKRRMREAYRINKNKAYQTLEAQNKKMIVSFFYTAKKEEKYSVIEAAVLKLLSKIVP